MSKCSKISPYVRRPLVIYDFATAPFSISLYMRKIWFSFLSVHGFPSPYANLSSWLTLCVSFKGTFSLDGSVLFVRRKKYVIDYCHAIQSFEFWLDSLNLHWGDKVDYGLYEFGFGYSPLWMQEESAKIQYTNHGLFFRLRVFFCFFLFVKIDTAPT